MKKPEGVEKYWYIIDNFQGVDWSAGTQQYWRARDWKAGNCFRTEEAAVRALKEVKTIMKRISRES